MNRNIEHLVWINPQYFPEVWSSEVLARNKLGLNFEQAISLAEDKLLSRFEAEADETLERRIQEDKSLMIASIGVLIIFTFIVFLSF